MALSFWEQGKRRLPGLLPLAPEALEYRLRKEGDYGSMNGVPGVQKEK